ncbi:MAG: hypothetical protein JSR50_10665 [Proteobacteria bacterium]|nr:hypothetical protein [Pseudomonadota bacterium]
MDEPRKAPASAGAQWLIDGFALLKASPGGFGVMGVLYGVFAAVVIGMAILVPQVGFAVQALQIIAAPILTGGMVWAAGEVAQGRDVGPAAFGEPLRQGKVGALLVTLLPQIVLGLVMAMLLVVLVGVDNMQVIASVMEKMQNAGPGAQPDPALIATLPMGRMLLWLLCVVVLAFMLLLMTFVAIPGVMLGGNSGIEALQRSWRAGLRNLPAVLVFAVVLFITLVGLTILIAIIGAIVRLVAGEIGQMVVSQLVMMTVLMPVMAGALSSAWRSMLGDAADQPPALPTGQLQA